MSKRNDRREAFLERRTQELARQDVAAFLEMERPEASKQETEQNQMFTQNLNESASANLSTGPKTLEGKAISSRNALTHGGCSTATLIIGGESLDDFKALEKRWFQGYGLNPDKIKNEHEADLIRQAARADWFYQRSDRNYAEAYAALPADILDWTEDHHKLIARFQRYRTANANVLNKHRKAVEDYRKARAKELQQTQAMQHKNERLAMARQKHKKKMADDAPIDWPSTFTEMKQTAIRLGFREPDEE